MTHGGFVRWLLRKFRMTSQDWWDLMLIVACVQNKKVLEDVLPCHLYCQRIEERERRDGITGWSERATCNLYSLPG